MQFTLTRLDILMPSVNSSIRPNLVVAVIMKRANAVAQSSVLTRASSSSCIYATGIGINSCAKLYQERRVPHHQEKGRYI